MERVRVRDVIDLYDYNRESNNLIVIDDGNDHKSYIAVNSMLLDFISDFTPACIGVFEGRLMIKLLEDDFERIITYREDSK